MHTTINPQMHILHTSITLSHFLFSSFFSPTLTPKKLFLFYLLKMCVRASMHWCFTIPFLCATLLTICVFNSFFSLLLLALILLRLFSLLSIFFRIEFGICASSIFTKKNSIETKKYFCFVLRAHRYTVDHEIAEIFFCFVCFLLLRRDKDSFKCRQRSNV